MLKRLKRFESNKLIHPPKWLRNSIQYLVQMGSVAYGVSNDMSDIDVYGFGIPPKNIMFPHTAGYLQGFDKNIPNFDQWQEHHIFDVSNQTEYDFQVFGILKYFRLVMDNNPNMIDSLFVPQRCVLHTTQIGNHIRENRSEFLHKGSYHKFKGYAYSQLHKMNIKDPKEGSKRYEQIKKYGYDLKFAYHIVRLLDECEQILIEHDIDLQRNREQLKSIRRGEWTVEQIQEHFEMKEKSLENLYNTSDLRHKPNMALIKVILMECLEMYFGSIDKMVQSSYSKEQDILDQIRQLVN